MPLTATIDFDDGSLKSFPVIERGGRKWVVLMWLEPLGGKEIRPTRMLLLETLRYEQMNPGHLLLSDKLPSLLYASAALPPLAPQFVVEEFEGDPGQAASQ